MITLGLSVSHEATSMFIDSDNLIVRLDEAFPDIMPRSVEGIEDLRFLQGERRVIDWLKDLFTSEEQEALLNVHG